MNAKIEFLKTLVNGEEFYVFPRTLIRCITNENGDNLEDVLKAFIENHLKSGLVSIGDADTLDGKHASEFLTEVTKDAITKALGFTPAQASHNHAASQVTAGTLGGKVLGNATSVATLGDKQVRNIYAGTTDMVAGTTTLTTGDIYIVYE